jgi:hypothetical protein
MFVNLWNLGQSGQYFLLLVPCAKVRNSMNFDMPHDMAE